MRVLIIGATGRTGRELVRQSLERGYEVVAYVRRPEALQPQSNVVVAVGTLDDVNALTRAMHGVDAVLVAIGNAFINRNAPLLAWALPAIITAMQAAGVRRVVVLSGLGVGNTRKNTRLLFRVGAAVLFGGVVRDHAAGESTLRDGGLEWTTVHPGLLVNGPRTRNPFVVDAASGAMMPVLPRARRADVAYVMLQVLADPATYGKELIVASRPDRR